MLGLLGDRVFVNGRPAPLFEVREGSYRLPLLNGSNARIYKLAWSDGKPDRRDCGATADCSERR
jgi:FtsP/CotA-like multicopper oxidase with cupredoxin domain